MEIKTKRLILRDHFLNDWVEIHEYASIPEVSKYDSWGPNTEKDSKDFVDRMIQQAEEVPRFKYDLAIFHKQDQKVIGGVGVRRASQESYVADLGYAINPNYQGQGFATEAVQAILRLGFDKLGLKIIFATCDVKNIASYKVMEKCGMIKVGELKNFKEFKGSWHDSFRYEILKS